MTEVPINYLAVIVAALFNMVLGFLWYGPFFGKQWMALSGINRDTIDQSKAKGMNKLYAMATVGSLLMSYVLAHSLVFASAYMQVEGITAGITVGFWSWLGFVFPVTLGSVLWDGKPFKLFVINTGYYLVTLVIMGVILAVWA